MATAPTGEETLTPDDAGQILNEILQAETASYILGLQLMLPLHTVDNIFADYDNTRKRFLQVIIAFLRRVEPRPTWRVIVNALRTPAVDLPALANTVEQAHCPAPIARPNIPLVQEFSVEQVKTEIQTFHKRFTSIKKKTIRCLKQCEIAVQKVVFLLTSIFAVGEHRMFLEENHKALHRSENHWELFGLLNLYWNYLMYDLLDYVIEEHSKNNSAFSDVSQDMMQYKEDLKIFRENTTLDVFCLAEPAVGHDQDPPPGFRKMVVRHDWPKTITLEEVEKFRQRYAHGYNLRKFAMILHNIGTGSYIVTWFVPVTVTETLRQSIAQDLLGEFGVSRLEIAGVCVYPTPDEHEVVAFHPAHLDGDTAQTNVSQQYTSYTYNISGFNRGQHKFHVQVNGKEIDGSPFAMTVFPDPTKLGNPVRTVTGLDRPYGIAIDRFGTMVVSEWSGHSVSKIDTRGIKTTFGSYGFGKKQMKSPAGIAVDKDENIYVSSQHKLQKFTISGKFIDCVGQEGRKAAEFNNPRGVTLYNDEVYVCDRNNDRIQVFDLDLSFKRAIGSPGNGNGQFNRPLDVTFDSVGNMYVADWGNGRVQVMDIGGKFITFIGNDKIQGPSALHIADRYLFVSDFSFPHIVVYETSGKYVTEYGKYGQTEGTFDDPYSIASCPNGFIYVCDSVNNRVQVF